MKDEEKNHRGYYAENGKRTSEQWTHFKGQVLRGVNNGMKKLERRSERNFNAFLTQRVIKRRASMTRKEMRKNDKREDLTKGKGSR